MRDEKKNKKSKLFFPYHLISKKELGASQTQVSKITSKMLEHQIEVFDENQNRMKLCRVDRAYGWGKKGSRNFIFIAESSGMHM